MPPSRRMRLASRTISTPFTSSVPTLRRPTVGRSTSNTMRAIAAPITAMSTRWAASAPIVAPTSSTIDSPRVVGQIAAIAGRSIWAMVLRQTLDMAISAPVLPADTQASASPSRTAWTAIHMDDFQRPIRRAWLGLSSIAIVRSEWRSSTAPSSFGCWPRSGLRTASSPTMRNFIAGWRSSASAAPGTTTAGPASPPMASSEMRTGCDIPGVKLGREGSRTLAIETSAATCFCPSAPHDPSLGRKAASRAKGPSSRISASGCSNAIPGFRG